VSKNPAHGQAELGYIAQLESRVLKFRTRMKSVTIKGKRRGFLPFDTNPFDRVFVSIILTVAIHLLWMRFLEEHITLTIATILTLILTAIIVVRG
jgi:predicted small integral membrane protein